MRFKDSKPFESMRLAEDRVSDKSWVITLRVNEEEYNLIMKAKEVLDVEADTKALKIIARVGLNVLLSVFGEKTIKYLSGTKRERKSDYETISKVKNDGFVIPKEPNL